MNTKPDKLDEGMRRDRLADHAAGKKDADITSDTTYYSARDKLRNSQIGTCCMTPEITPIAKIFSPQNEGMTVDQSLAIYMRRKRARVSPKTLTLYRQSIELFQKMLGNPVLHQIMPHDVEDWIADLASERLLYENHPTRKPKKGTLSTRTVNGHLLHIRTFLIWCVKSREIPLSSNPAADVAPLPSRKLPPKAIGTRDFARLAEVAQSYIPYNIRADRHALYTASSTALVYALGSTAARIDGLVTANYGDLRTDENDEYVLRTVEKGRGGGKIHDRKFGASASVALLDWLAVHPSADSMTADTPLFTSLHGQFYGKRMTDHGVRNRLRTLAKAANISGRVNPHAFRHRAIMEWLKVHKDPTKVQQMVGHAGISSTMQYVRWADDEVMQAHRDADWTDG